MTSRTIASLKFFEGVLVDCANDEGKYLGRWDELAWKPLIAVGVAICELIRESLKSMSVNGVVERRPPYIRPDQGEVEIGDDIVLDFADDLNEEQERRLFAGVMMFCLLIRSDADGISHGFDFSGLIEDSERARIARHADNFTRANNGKAIPEAFIAVVGKDHVLFSGHFNRSQVEPISFTPPKFIDARIEGAERNKERASCTLEIGEEIRQKAVFHADAELLIKVREAIWTDSLYKVQICVRGSAKGKEVWELIDLKPCASAETRRRGHTPDILT